MSPFTATLLCLLLVLYVLSMDWVHEAVSKALWVPLIWMFLGGSRFLSQWMDPNPANNLQDLYAEGNPVDATAFLALITTGIFVLWRRRPRWRELITRNRWIWLYFLFGLLSVLWSDYPDVSLKRWVKALGNVIMALVVLTETHPYEAVGTLLRRLALLLVPLSILFIKYYPDLGRTYDRWTYEAMFTGVATHKNGLGQLCVLAGIYFCWDLLYQRGDRRTWGGGPSTLLRLAFLGMTVWLLYIADSATSLVAFVLVAAILLVGRMPSMARAPGRLPVVALVAIVGLGVLDVGLGVSDLLLDGLGRDSSLTTRVPMWEGLLLMGSNPLVGVGYESFWLGARLPVLWEAYGRLNQAHNGYLETYLTLGLCGLGLVLLGILSGLVKARRQLATAYSTAILRLCCIIVAVVYNWTEASLHGVNNVWLLLFLGLLDVPGRGLHGQPRGSCHPGHPRSSADYAHEPHRWWVPRIV